MKKDWQCVYDLLNGTNTSGFGYDNVNHCVTAEDPVWEAYLDIHKDAARWKHKKFPYYEELCIVFEKDRAQGNRAKDFLDLKQEVNLEEEIQGSDDGFLDSEEVSRNASVHHEATSQSGRSKKRKTRSDDGFNNAVGLITESLKEISKDLSQGIKLDMKINELSEKIPPKILEMTSLSQLEKFKALTKIRSDPINVQNFWEIEEGDREAWVKYILEG
ncbi:hypothetical protein L1887_38914 [Cichorium endivia]|nr:hypothetical protein L1887_38914 [Cichorium endivia]